MNQQEKQERIQWIESLQNEVALEKLRFIKEHHLTGGDWWDTLLRCTMTTE